VSKQQHQEGIVSIIVATLLIIIVSLIVLAFAQVSRREQRESLDAQLSTQAYYAAETGVNAATAVVQTLATTNPAGLSQPDCKDTTGGPFSTINYDLDSTNPNTIAITCLTVDAAPQDLSYVLSTDSAKVVPIIPANGATIDSLTFSWPTTRGYTNTQTACKSVKGATAWTLPTETTWKTTWGCPFMAIRADFVPTDSGFSRDTLISNDQVSLMLPVASGSNLGVGNLNDVSPALCSATTCSVTFDNLNHTKMYLRLVSAYEGGEKVTITGSDGTNPLKFTSAQAKIDSTGRAQDVLRRIVVSAPLQSGNDSAPVQALVSGDSVCKRFGVFTGFYLNYAPPGSGC
jgi:hypothetical protein